MREKMVLRQIRIVRYYQKHILGKFIQSARFFFLYSFLEPIDVALKWFHLCAEVQILRLESISLRLHIFKLAVERKHLHLLLSIKRDALLSEEISESSHD